MRLRTAVRPAASASLSLVREWTATRLSPLSGPERRAPVLVDRASGILACFGSFSEIVEHRITLTLQGSITFANARFHSFPFAFQAQFTELLMRIEHKRGKRKASRQSRTAPMHTDNIESVAAKTEGEIGVRSVATDGRVPVEFFSIDPI